MKTTSILNTHVITGTLCAGAVLFLAGGASAQVLYESEQYTGAINKFNSAGVATTFVSSSPALVGQIAFNSSGDLFVGNNGTAGITEIAPNGTAGSFGSGFDSPKGVAIDSAGDVFVASELNGEIMKLSPNGSSDTLFASGLNNPYFLTFNSSGDLFESDWGSGDIYEFSPTGTKTLYASGFTKPSGLAFNSAGDLFVSDASNGGTVSEITSSGTSAIISLSNPQGLAFNNAGDLFIAVNGSPSIEEITSGGASVFSTQVNSPIGLAFGVPEPSTLALLAMGASTVALRLRRKK